MKYPFVRQNGYKNCGAASFLMIIKYYNGDSNLDNISDMVYTTKTGTSAFNIVSAAREIGFESNGLKIPFEKLISFIKKPVIAHVIAEEKYLHFVVIYKVNIKKKYLIVADPAKKIKKISYADFSKIYNGTIITFNVLKPIPVISKGKPLKTFLKELAYNETEDLKLIYTLSFIGIILSLIGSFYIKLAVDNLSSNNLKLLVYFFSFLALLKIISEFYRNKITIYLDKKLNDILILNSFKKVILLPYSYFAKRSAGEMTEKIVDLTKLKDMILSFVILSVVDIPLIIISLFMIFLINKSLALLAIIISLMYLLLVFIFKGAINDNLNKRKFFKEDMFASIVNLISGYETYKGLNAEKVHTKKFSNKYFDYIKLDLNLNKIINYKLLLLNVLSEASGILVIYIGLTKVIDGTISIGMMLAFEMIFTYYISPFKRIGEAYEKISEGTLAYKKVEQIFNDSNETSKLLHKGPLKIEASGVDFSYDGSNKVLKNINLKINQGEKIFVCGPSGSGKSTFFKLLKGYYISKKITINGICVNDYENIFNKIMYIPARSKVFPGVLYDSFYNKKKISKAINIAEISDYLIKGNNELNMVIEEDNFNLSVGEAQRLALAIALSKNFEVLILDEALNSLNVDLERKILKKLLTNYEDKTIIFISHRLNNLDLFKRKIEFEEGRIICDIKKSKSILFSS